MDSHHTGKSGIAATLDAAEPVKKPETAPWKDKEKGDYRCKDGIMYRIKVTQKQSIKTKSKKAADQESGSASDEREMPQIVTAYIALTLNFTAWIVEENLLDDGIETKAAFMIEGRLQDGRHLPPISIAASEFAGMGWITKHWGTRAILATGATVKDNFRAALQVLSGDVPRKVVYQHTGWRQIGGAWLYLSDSGAIGARGLDTSYHIDTGRMPYLLPAPPENRRQLAGLLLELLNIAPSNAAVGVVLFCAVSRAPLGECKAIDFSLFFAGRSGSQKSEATAIALAFFGQFSARNLPANFTDTESDLELKAHAVKDAIFVIDDFAPSTNQAEANRLYAKSERLFRAVGNQAGRGRRNTDLSAKPSYHPRGLVIATGEDVPRGSSLLGRMLIIEMKRGDIDLPKLSEFQRWSNEGQLAAFMAAYLQWLAPQLQDLKRELPK